jgi:hypothetical protein
MSERTALEIASRLEALIPIAGGLAVEALRRQHAEIDRLTAERDKSIVAAVAAEREACAAVCDDLEATFPGTKTGNTLQWAAEKIRARSSK